MSFRKVSILGVDFVNTTMRDMLACLKSHLLKEEKTFVVTANPEIVMFAEKDSDYKQLLKKATYITPDGIGVVKAAKMLNEPMTERVTGYDMLRGLLQIANDEALKVYMVGAKPEVLEKAVSNVKNEYPNVNIVGFHDGYFNEEQSKEIAKEIAEKEPDLVFVALGFPRQEQWIASYYDMYKKGIFMGVGGSFDVLAGEVKRAPVIWQKLNVEWLYRLVKQPSRWRRMLVLPLFMLEVKKRKNEGSEG
ncbi:WecB/TagA/CpsF family glycosyltransferase [Bacillus taeanensis]|uniref:N-acetylglucosaminyldiphosphoundecaprenol N-acetyl-beta-D-mannosaminyltransferase n=1 Tax=Bacillus taeanensis TaxID=273032 RepID=A0A366XPZ7_9BACI|nr:WecB/TagA/CpsF family glycosyltransferase [Bacillus taeanensis]RBW67598.1 glycosyltransferase [Bacillus taeanensis]